MKEYPSIPSWSQVGGIPVYVFGKYDGSNLRAEWQRKKGFVKFGKRHGLLDDATPFLREGEPLFLAKYGEALAKTFHDMRYESATAYFEFYGPQSFAGSHAAETHEVTLFDISIHKIGFLEPRDFLKHTRGLETAILLHQGNFTQEIAQAVSDSTLEGMPFEGVVCKGSRDRKTGLPYSFKWKSLAWLNRLKEKCGTDEQAFNALR